MNTEGKSEDCQHIWREGYYGNTCAKCGMFYAYGCAPWDDLVDVREEEGNGKN